jgi:hypothetical protein
MNTFVQVLVKHGYSVLFVSVFAFQMGLPVPAILFSWLPVCSQGPDNGAWASASASP